MSAVRVGIDPGKQTGFAVYDPHLRRLTEVWTVSFWEVFTRLQDYRACGVAEVTIEVPTTKHVWHKAASGPRALQRQGVNVGSVIREAELLAEGLEREGYNVRRVTPRGKTNAEKFKAFTGWCGRTNQHERDAALMCFGRGHNDA